MKILHGEYNDDLTD